MRNNRLSRWQSTLIVVDKIDNNISIIVNQLAKLDSKLVNWSKRHGPKSKIDKEILDDFEEYLTISYLWVLGAYEIIRTIHQACIKNNIFPQETLKEIKDTKDYFARLRMPLAKLEPEKYHKHTDHSIAFPHNTQKGIGWLLGKGLCITRIALSDKFLELLETMKGRQ